MIKHLNKQKVHEYLLEQEKIIEARSKPKYITMPTMKNGKWSNQVCVFLFKGLNSISTTLILFFS